ncbi:MAG: hypothetical protein ABIU06_09470 [Anaerolineales bacterium]
MPRRKSKKKKKQKAESTIFSIVNLVSDNSKTDDQQNRIKDFTWGVIGNLIASLIISFSTIFAKKYLPNVFNDTVELIAISIPLTVFIAILLISSFKDRIFRVALTLIYSIEYRFLRVSLVVVAILIWFFVTGNQIDFLVGLDFVLVFQKFFSGAGLGIILMIWSLFSHRQNKMKAFRGALIVTSLSGIIGIFTPLIINPLVNFFVFSITQLLILNLLGRRKLIQNINSEK